jgi:hypothetical protein
MSLKSFDLNISNLGRWIAVIGIVWLFSTLGLGWLVNGFFILVGLLILLPVLGFFGFRFWLQNNLIQDACPVCHYEFTGLNKTQLQCPNCSEPLQVIQGKFNRLTPAGTIDVQAVEVSSPSRDD